MKPNIAIAVVLFAFSRIGFAVILFSIDAPQDDLGVRRRLGDRPELEPLHAAYTNLIQTYLWPIKFDQLEKIFGPKLDTATNWWGRSVEGSVSSSGPKLEHHPDDLILPLFAPAGGSNCSGTMAMIVSGLHHNEPERNKSRTDLYAIGDVGYVELYSHVDGQKVQTAVIYFRDDYMFVPLKSTNDFAARLQWEQTKFDAVKEWLDEHLYLAEVPLKVPLNAAAQSSK